MERRKEPKNKERRILGASHPASYRITEKVRLTEVRKDKKPREKNR